MCRTKTRLVIAVFVLLWASACFAENADRDQPMRLEADQVLVDDAHQISTFTGNVRLSQGSLLVRGDRVVVEQDKQGFQNATVFGKPAEFRQKREGSDEYVEGYGERIEYDAHAGVVDFYVQARLKRNLDEVRGEHITYSIKTEIFQVNSGDASSVNRPPQRVRAVLQPHAKAQPQQSSQSQLPPESRQHRQNSMDGALLPSSAPSVTPVQTIPIPDNHE